MTLFLLYTLLGCQPSITRPKPDTTLETSESSTSTPQTNVVQSDQVQIDTFIQNLEQHPRSANTWGILTAAISHTFSGQSTISNRWVPQTDTTPERLSNQAQYLLYIYPHYVPKTHAEIRQITDNKVAVVGQIPQSTMEQCDAPLTKGRLYTTGSYDITKEFVDCMKSNAFRLYLNQVNRIDVPIRKDTFDELYTLTVDSNLDEASIQHLLGFEKHLTILGNQPPQWLLDNIEQLQAHSLNLPQIEDLSTKDIARLAKFNGHILKLNTLRTLSPSKATAFESFAHTLELKGLHDLKARSFTALTKGHTRLETRVDNLEPAHFKQPLGQTAILHGVTDIPVKTAMALTQFSGHLSFPDLESLSPTAYMYLLGGSKDHIAQGRIPDWQRRSRHISIPFEHITMTVEWVQTIIFLESNFWKTPVNKRVRERVRWLSRFGAFTPDGLELMLKNIGSSATLTDLNGLQTITPEIATMLVEHVTTTPPKPLELNGLTSIDDESLSRLLQGSRNVSLNGLSTLTANQGELLSRSETSNIWLSLNGIQTIDSAVLAQILPLKHLRLPSWIQQQPAYQHYHFNRHPNGPYQINFRGVDSALFQEIDFSEVTRLDLQTLSDLTPRHIEHLAKFNFEFIEVPAHRLTPATISALKDWPHPNTVFDIEVQNTPIERLHGIEHIPIQRLLLGNITTENPDLHFLFASPIPHLEIESSLPIQGVSLFKGESLSVHRYHDSSPNRYSPQAADTLIQQFNGQTLTLGFVSELTPALATTIMSRTFHLRIHTDSLAEDNMNETLHILQQSELRNLDYTLHIEGLEAICDGTLETNHPFQHINESETCTVAREQMEALEYWENHDCSEHDSGDH